jgi:hypothetical protein
MFVFLLSNYSLPFTLIELDSFDCTHTHRTFTNATWKEDMHLKVRVPGLMPTLRIANDNQKAVDHGQGADADPNRRGLCAPCPRLARSCRTLPRIRCGTGKTGRPALPRLPSNLT